MRILDQESDKATGQIMILLTQSEASELRDKLNHLLSEPFGAECHEHVPNEDFSKEVTICIYNPKKPGDSFDRRTLRLINEDR